MFPFSFGREYINSGFEVLVTEEGYRHVEVFTIKLRVVGGLLRYFNFNW